MLEEDGLEISHFGDAEMDIGEEEEEDVQYEITTKDLIFDIEHAEQLIDQKTTLAYEQCLVALAKANFDKACHCGKRFEIQTRMVGSALYLNWVSDISKIHIFIVL